MTLPWYLWGVGANSAGQHLPTIDKVRCTNCNRWTRNPIFYELDRILCMKCQTVRSEIAYAWLASLTPVT